MKDSVTMRTTSAVWVLVRSRNFSKLREGLYSVK